MMMTAAGRLTGIAARAAILGPAPLPRHGTVVTAQTARAADSSEASVNALVAEVRALRAELAQAAQRTARVQLLLGRVQMQEQRIAYLDSQRAQIAGRLGDQTDVVTGVRQRVQQLENGGCDGVPERQECDQMLRQMRQDLEAQAAIEIRLRAQENDILNSLATEQGRWTDFNSRLDELERTLAR